MSLLVKQNSGAKAFAFAILVTILSLMALIGVVLMAEFGMSILLFGLVWLWLLSIGLPTTIGFLIVISIWGRSFDMYGFLNFLVVASIFSLLLQFGAFYFVLENRSRKNSNIQ